MALPFTGPDITLAIYKGSEFIWSAVYYQTNNDVSPIVSTAVSLADYTPSAQIRVEANGFLLLDISSYITLEPADVTGRILIAIPASQTASLKGPGVWDMFLTPADPNSAFAIFSGAVTLDGASTL